MGKLFPDVHRELHRVNVLGDVVAIEVSIRGTFLGAFETPAGGIQQTGAKVDIPTADFWSLRNGKVEMFDCHIAFTTLFAQLGILPDYASAVAASAPNDKADRQGCAAAEQPRTSGRVTQGSDGPAVFV